MLKRGVVRDEGIEAKQNASLKKKKLSLCMKLKLQMGSKWDEIGKELGLGRHIAVNKDQQQQKVRDEMISACAHVGGATSGYCHFRYVSASVILTEKACRR